MIVVRGLIWDDWNRGHLAKHSVTPEEVEEVCQGSHSVVESYRKRVLIVGRTNTNRLIAVVLSPEDKNSKKYGNDTYYPITAFEKEVRK